MDPNLILTIIWILVTIAIGAPTTYFAFRDRRSSRQLAQAQEPEYPFDIVRPNQVELIPPKLFRREESEFAVPALVDWRIPYQQRDRGVDHQQEIKKTLEQDNWVIVTGPSGIGKTREVVEIAQHYNQCGWTVMIFRGELEGDRLPHELFQDTRRNVLLVFDDLHVDMRRNEPEARSPQADGLQLSQREPLQVRLLAALEHCKQYQIPDRCLKVLATARDEAEPETPGQPSPWDMLGWDRYELWAKFTRYPLPKAEEQAWAACMKALASKTQTTLGCDPSVLANQSDLIFRTLQVNFTTALIDAAKTGRPSITSDTFEPTLRGSWKLRYDKAVKRYSPLGKYLYNAVDLLAQADAELHPYAVQQISMMLRRPQRWRRWWVQRKLQQTLTKLDAREGLLSPRDGQIEAIPERLQLKDYCDEMFELCLRLFPRQPAALESALANLSLFFSSLDNHQTASQGYQALTNHFINNEEYYFYLGNTLVNLDQYDAAIASYDKALKIKPDTHEAWNNRGIALGELGRYEEEITSYDKALEIKQDKHEAWNNRGIALGELGRYEEEITSYDKALEIKQDKHEAWYNRGVALRKLGQYDAAIASYDEALEIKPDYHEAWNNRGVALGKLGQYDAAIASFDQALEIKPDDHEVWYNRARAYALQGQTDASLECLAQATRLDETYRAMARADSGFDGICDDERFQALVREVQ